jgi:uncharacterized protein
MIIGLLLLMAGQSVAAQPSDLERSCLQGVAASCSTLASTFREKDAARSALLYLRACAAGPPTGGDCRQAGFQIGVAEQSRTAKRDFTRNVNLLIESCDHGALHDCNTLATMFLFGAGGMVTKDRTRALPLFARACDGGIGSACSNLADALADRDGKRATELYEKACTLGFPSACTEVAGNYINGEHVAKDTLKALALFQKGCDGGDALGCAGVGFVYSSGEGITRDLITAVRSFKKSCDMGEMRGCQGLAGIYQQNPAEAVALFKKACGDDRAQCAQFDALVEGLKAGEQMRKR